MADYDDDDLGGRKNLINRTADTDDLSYESQLGKRKTLDDQWDGDDEQKKGRIMKIILFILFGIVIGTGLIIVIVKLANRNDANYPENHKDYNMFMIEEVTPGNNKNVIKLKSKIAKNSASNDVREVETTVGTISETNNTFADNLVLEISMIGSGVMRSTFKNPDDPHRWDVTNIDGFIPNRDPDPLTQLDSVGLSISKSNSDFEFSSNDPISGFEMLTTHNRAFVFTDKYIEYGFTLPSRTLFGLGQHNSKFLLGNGNWTMFNRDQPGSPIATGQGKQHLYGTHPFIMAKTKDNKFIGVLFYNSNPQQVNIKLSPSGKSVITYRTIGGILDIYTFSADTADNVIKRYNELVGKPSLPPFWSMGFHQCSWQYNSTQDLRDAVNNYTANGYMFDTIWTDIMYMEDYIDFTLNREKFADLKDFVNELHSNHHYFVPIVDAGISMKTDSQKMNWYNIGNTSDVFIKSSKNPTAVLGGNLIAEVWPGFTAFVDFLHPNAQAFWTQALDALYNLVPYDGLWLDMNEPSNFCQDAEGKSLGECYPDKEMNPYKIDKDPSEIPVKAGEFDNIPFIPGEDPLVTKTISMDAYLYDPNDEPTGTYVMYNVHNMYGTLETKATFRYLQQKSTKRPLIISRDSFVGHGQYGSIWTGDNSATFDDMKLSINQIMSFNMFGMPFVGGDICGFSDNTTPELCARWAQVGAFYPFMRNHYAIGKTRQEFYTFEEKYQKGMKESLRQRYSLLRYYYTMLYKSSAFGDPTVRHPLYDWPDLNEMVNDEISFMIGKSVRITANFNGNDKDDLKAYFPKGKWLDYKTLELFEVKKKVEQRKLYNGFDYTNVHIRDGSIVPFQDTSEESGNRNTYDLIRDQVRLLVIPDSNGNAQGNLFIARGENTDEKYQYFTMLYSNRRLHFRLDSGDPTDTGAEYNEVLEEVNIYSTDENVLKSDFACAITSDQTFTALTVTQVNNTNGSSPYLKISGGVNTIEFDRTHTIQFGVKGVDENLCDRGYVASKQSTTSVKHIYNLKKGSSATNDQTLTLTIQLLEMNNLQVTITNGTGRFEVPRTVLKNGGPKLSTDPNASVEDYITISNNTSKFKLQIHESQNPSSVYFEISEDGVVFTDYFLSLETNVNTNQKIYGFGERVRDFFITDGIYTTWSMDQTDPIDDGLPPGKNVYGTHPVYFTRSASGSKYHWGMFNLNANAQDTKVQLNQGLGAKISHYISGNGIFDMYFFLDNKTPEDAVIKYHNIIGNTLLPPYWAFGWHQCKYGYQNTSVLKSVYDNYNAADFPMDTLWSDIDHMDKYRDFTVDSKNFGDLGTFISDTLHKDNRRYVPIIDAGIGIATDGSYDVYNKGKKEGLFIKSGARNDVLYGKVWPGYSAFPDWTHPKATDWWVDSMKGFHDQIQYDGIWLDMNEVANFCTGPCIPDDVVSDTVVNKLIYSPGSRSVEEKCLSVDGKHNDGWTELNYHSLFGFMQGVATNKYFTDNNKRALIIARSTFAGQGKYTSHWLGDNFSEWKYLKYSIGGVLSMNIFGINFAGADICGFLGSTNDNLCQKWTNVGAMYPFARNHNDIGSIHQEPYVFPPEIQTTMRHALRWRYALLRYFYTQMYLVSKQGGTFWKPLFFVFPDESHAYDDIERNVMIGPSIKFSPMLDESNDKTQKFIMPAGVWCNIIDYSCMKNTKMSDVSLNTDAATLNLHIGPGQIIPLQREAEIKKVKNVVELNNVNLGLMINPNGDQATGMFYIDDGESLNQNGLLIKMDFSFDGKNSCTMTFTTEKSDSNDASNAQKISLIEIVGADYTSIYSKCKKMKIDGGEEIPSTFSNKTLKFSLTTPVDIANIKQIDFTSQGVYT